MKARQIVGHIFLAWLSIFMVLLGLVGIEEFGFEWLWIDVLLLGAFTLGFQSHFLYTKIFANK